MPTDELYGSFHFLLEIQGVVSDTKIIVGGFKSVSGMDSETEIVEFKQGTVGCPQEAGPHHLREHRPRAWLHRDRRPLDLA